MRILVVSDTHGRCSKLFDVMRKHSDIEIVIHLGDGGTDLDYVRYEFPNRMVYAVKGNCDFYSELPLSDTLTFENTKIFFAHGHTYNVKMTTDVIEAAARNCGASVCLFGHTHCPLSDYKDGLYIMNPGSLGHPRDGAPTYGILDITPSGVMTNILKC